MRHGGIGNAYYILNINQNLILLHVSRALYGYDKRCIKSSTVPMYHLLPSDNRIDWVPD